MFFHVDKHTSLRKHGSYTKPNDDATFNLSAVRNWHTHHGYAVQLKWWECGGILKFRGRAFMLEDEILHALFSEIEERNNFLLQILNTRMSLFTQSCDLKGGAWFRFIPDNELVRVVSLYIMPYVISIS